MFNEENRPPVNNPGRCFLRKILVTQERSGYECTIYPLLNRFKKDGLVDTYLAESHNGPPRKYYRITDAGRAEFQESVKEWTEFNKAVRRLLAEGGESYA